MPLRPELERARDLQHAVRERAGADPHHEQERLVAEVAGGPESEEDLHGAEHERQPPERPRSSGDGHDDVEDSAEQQVEREDRRERLEAVPGMDEGEDRDHGEGDRERDASQPRPPVRRRNGEQLEQRGAGARRADEDRDRAHGPRVELEDEEREHEPQRADDEVEPPELRRFFRAGRGSGRRGAEAAPGDATLPRFADNADKGDDVAAAMADVTIAPQAPTAPAQDGWYRLPPEEVAAAMDVDPVRGLAAAEAASRLERHGPNRFAEAKSEPR